MLESNMVNDGRLQILWNALHRNIEPDPLTLEPGLPLMSYMNQKMQYKGFSEG